MSIKIWLLTLLSVISGNLYCMDYPQVPAEVQQILDQHPAEMAAIAQQFEKNSTARLGINVLQPEWLPGYFIKYGKERILNQAKLRRIIDMHQLNLLSVPNKYLYDKHIVIAEKIEGKNGAGQNLNIEQVQQLWSLSKYANHCDTHPGNYVTTADGRLVIIDTDDSAMPKRPGDFTSKFRTSIKYNEQKQHFSAEAYQWLTDTIKQHDAQKLPAKRRLR